MNNVALSGNWSIEIIPPVGLVVPQELNESMYISGINKPSYGAETVSTFVYSKKITIVKLLSIDDTFTIGIVGDAEYKILDFFDRWHKRKNINIDGIRLLRYPSDYYGTIKLKPMDGCNESYHVKYINVYPTSIPDIRFNKSVEPIEYEIGFTFEKTGGNNGKWD